MTACGREQAIAAPVAADGCAPGARRRPASAASIPTGWRLRRNPLRDGGPRDRRRPSAGLRRSDLTLLSGSPYCPDPDRPAASRLPAEHWFGTDQSRPRHLRPRRLWQPHHAHADRAWCRSSCCRSACSSAPSPAISAACSTSCSCASPTCSWRFPRLVLALAIASALGPSIQNVIIAIAHHLLAALCPPARAETLTTRKSDYVMAAKMQGASHARIIWNHIVPLCLPSIIVRLTLDMAGIVLIAAGLGFLGIGAQPPSPEWGAMVSTGRDYILDQCWVATHPGAAIFVVSLGFNLLGDGLRDVFDPKATGTRRERDDRDAAAASGGSAGQLPGARRTRAGGARHQLHARPRAAGHRRRIRLRQVDHRPRHPGTAAEQRHGRRPGSFGCTTSTCCMPAKRALARHPRAGASPWCCRIRNSRSTRS